MNENVTNEKLGISSVIIGMNLKLWVTKWRKSVKGPKRHETREWIEKRGCRNLIAKNVQEHEIAQNSRREGNVIAKAGHGFRLPSGRFQRKSGLKESVPGRVGIEEITSYVKLTYTGSGNPCNREAISRHTGKRWHLVSTYDWNSTLKWKSRSRNCDTYPGGERMRF